MLNAWAISDAAAAQEATGDGLNCLIEFADAQQSSRDKEDRAADSYRHERLDETLEEAAPSEQSVKPLIGEVAGRRERGGRQRDA